MEEPTVEIPHVEIPCAFLPQYRQKMQRSFSPRQSVSEFPGRLQCGRPGGKNAQVGKFVRRYLEQEARVLDPMDLIQNQGSVSILPH